MTSPRTRVSGIDASLDESPGPRFVADNFRYRDPELFFVSVKRIRTTTAAASWGRYRSDTALHDIQSTSRPGKPADKKIFARSIGVSGEAASGFLREQFRRVTFLEQRAEQLARTTFDVEFELRGPAEEPVKAPDLPEPESNPAQLHLRGTLSLDLEQCTVQYAANSRFRGGQLNVVLRADGDNETARIRGIQSQDVDPPSRLPSGSERPFPRRADRFPVAASAASKRHWGLPACLSIPPSSTPRFLSRVPRPASIVSTAVVDGISINTT